MAENSWQKENFVKCAFATTNHKHFVLNVTTDAVAESNKRVSESVK
jgi:hypothetical protein